MTLDVLWQDDVLLFINKPSGLLVHRGLGRDEVTLVDLVREYLDDTPRPVHRLDRGTSGVILFAKSADAVRSLQTSFAEGTARKVYVTLVRGIAPAEGEIDNPVPKGEGAERVPARSKFRRLETFPNAKPRELSLVEVEPETGRFHQIRRHMKHINHPVIGDANYGKGKLNRAIRERYGLSRLALHARELSIRHPVHDEQITVEAPMPDDLRLPLQSLR